MKRTSLLLMAVVVAVSSCTKDPVVLDGDRSPLNISSSYTSGSFVSNTATETDITSQLAALTVYMKKAQSGSYKLMKDSLNYYFGSNGSTSLRSITGSYYTTLIESVWFDEMVASSQNNYDPLNGSTASTGGVYESRLLNAKAKENIQEIEKGLYLAALYNHMVSISNSSLNDVSVDKMLAVIGGNPTFPNSYTSTVTSPDTDVLKYVCRRDKNDGTGFYSEIKRGFLKLKAAVAAGAEYAIEQNEAIHQIRNNIEKAMVATNINYCYGALSKLSATNPTDADKAGALHDLGEAVGFIHGLKAVSANARIITDAQIDEILNLLMAPNTSKGEMYLFITQPASKLPQLTTAQNKLKAIYNFSNAQMEDFKNNWVSIQAR